MVPSPKGRVRALVFDFDGLIIDSESPDLTAWSEVLAAYGCHLPIDAWMAGVGAASGTLDACALIEQQLGRPIDRAAVGVERRHRFLDLVSAQPILPGVETYLVQAGARSLLRAVASSASREWVMGQLIRLGLLDAFDCILCRDDVS